MNQYKSYSVSDVTQDTRETHVARQLTMLDKTLAELMESVGALDARLSSILREELKVVSRDDSKAVSEPLVPLAADLSHKRGQIESMIARLNSIRERIEL